MGFLDTIKDRLGLEPADDGYYDDYEDDYDDGYYDDRPADDRDDGRAGGLLGNTPRPEADSVSVYTRSGRPLGGNGSVRQSDDGYYDEPAARPARPEEPAPRRYAPTPTRPYTPAASDDARAAEGRDHQLTAVPRSSSSQLPAYVLKPQSYDDVQTVVRRVRTNQPVVLSFRTTNIDAAKRIFDFCAGLACGVGGAIEELGDRCFVVLPAGRELSQADMDKLVADGTVVRD